MVTRTREVYRYAGNFAPICQQFKLFRGMNIANPLPSTVSSVSFSFLTSDDIRRISVKQIKNPGVLESGRPVFDGLYDPALGPSDRSDMYDSRIFFSAFFLLISHSCATCRLTYFTCPGHYGHVELPSTVFHPLFMGNMYNLLRGVCMFCHRFKIVRVQVFKISLFSFLFCLILSPALQVHG